MQKIKAAGFNAFSIYNHWGFHSAAHGKLDFDTGVSYPEYLDYDMHGF